MIMRDKNFKELKVGQIVDSTAQSKIPKEYEVMEVSHAEEQAIFKQISEGNGHGMRMTVNKIGCERGVRILKDVVKGNVTEMKLYALLENSNYEPDKVCIRRTLELLKENNLLNG